MTTIEIKGMRFHAYVGCLPEEKENGVDLVVDFKGRISCTDAVAADSLDRTTDVREICRIVGEETAKPCNLLETLAERIITVLDKRTKGFAAMKVSVAKLNPGLSGAEWWSATARRNWNDSNPEI